MSDMESVGEPAAVCTIQAHRGEVSCADARDVWLATGGGDGALRLWRWRRSAGWQQAAGEPRAHRYGVTAARWAPTGILLASTGVDGAARLWAVRTLKPLLALVAPHAAAARSVCWATSERLLVGHDDGAVRAWRVHDATLLAYVRALEGAVHALTAFDGATLLLAACTEGVLKIFNLKEICSSGTEGSSGPAPLVWEDGAHDLGALCADGSACGRAAATGGHDARVRVWLARAEGATSGGVLVGHGGAVTALRWARDAALLVSASLDRTARVWSVLAGACVRVLPAHSRYLTCIVVPQNARYIMTGSNDKTIRTWSLSTFSIDEELEPECSPLVHFGLGDLKGIGPVDDDLLLDDGGCDSNNVASADRAVAACAWSTHNGHGGAINCVATHGDRLATACSDGVVRIFSWSEQDAEVKLEKSLGAHQYPVLSVDFGANGALLLSAGLDGRACLWEVETGYEVASLWAAGMAGSMEGESGGVGGVRCGRMSQHRPPLLLLATDAGVATLWTVDGAGSEPMHVYPEAGGGAACTCVAWAAGGAAAVAGGAGGALQLLAPPPGPAELCRLSDAHDLGVLSCDFAVDVATEGDKCGEEIQTYLLASGGMDELVKLWAVKIHRDGGTMVMRGALAAHGGAVQSVRWGTKLALATAGADRWARVWRIITDRDFSSVSATQMAAVPAGGAGGAPSATFLRPGMLAVGALTGRMALWRLPKQTEQSGGEWQENDVGVEPRWWGEAGVLHWLRDYVIQNPGTAELADEEERLTAAVRDHALTGAHLLDEPLDQLLQYFGYGVSDVLEASADEEQRAGPLRAHLLEELQWIRRPPLSPDYEARVPHELLCPLTHAAMRRPVRVSDGYTYEHAALVDWFTAVSDVLVSAAGAVSPITGRRLSGAPVLNRGLLYALRHHFASIEKSTTIPPTIQN